MQTLIDFYLQYETWIDAAAITMLWGTAVATILALLAGGKAGD
jgi:hypothetical protein